ncbi:putative sugar nucleotidyl transferase [Sphingobacterium sp. LRF_L2]|uniref:putative sugar nucleotidyl transferase n=1 Tax=Sphingobacterium sp. LRF_L2 TaxID=3369421 RepID=UPI003F5DFCEA
MLEVVLHDWAPWRQHLLPLVYTRPVGDLRVGILTLQQKWQHLLGSTVYYYTEPYLQPKFQKSPQATSYLVIRGNICPSLPLVNALNDLPLNAVLTEAGEWIAYKVETWVAEPNELPLTEIPFSHPLISVRSLEDIYRHNLSQLQFDYELLTNGVVSMSLHASNVIIGDQLFVGKNVHALCSTFNTTEGSIYIGNDAVIEEGSHLKGPLAIGVGARVKMGSKLYPNVSIGPGCTIAGEVNNAVLWGNCAKGHDGYLGCAVLGEGCNLGAGTSNSNLQNNWATVKIFDYKEVGYRDTLLPKVGTFMADYAMCGINSSLTTGSVIGVGAQVAMSNIIPKFVPDFSWFTDQKKETYFWHKFEEMLQHRAALKKESLSILDRDILKVVYELTSTIRQEYIK